MNTNLNKIALASVLTLVSATVSAAGFQIFQQNASGLGNSYAGSAAVADNASTIFFNPAGMSELKGLNISTGGSITKSSIKFTNNGSSVANLAGTGNGGDAGTTSLIPNFFLSKQIDEKYTLGIGVSAPYGSHSKFDDPFVGGAQALEFKIQSININPSIAYKPNQAVSIGFGINIQKFDAKYRRITGVNDLSGSSGPNLTLARTEMNLDDTSYGWNAGVLFKPDDKTKVGLSYRSKVKHTVKGTLATNGGGLNSVDPGLANIDIPDMAFFSVVRKIDNKWEVLGDISWTGWSSIPKIDVIRTSDGALRQSLNTSFKDSYRFAVGANYELNSNHTLKLGMAYDKTPVKGPDTRLVSLPDNDRIWLSVGSQYRLDKSRKIDFGLARVMIKDATIDNNQASVDPTANRGRVTGSYKSGAWLMGLQYSQAF